MKKFIPIAFVALFLVPSLTFASFDTSLKYGSRGDAVSTLQDFLSDQGFLKGSVDGKFGLGTLRAVEAFQTANGLDSDGYFGLASRTAANAILATIIAPSDKEEQAETGTVTTPVSPVLDSRGCSPTSLYSSTTGVSCSVSPLSPQSNIGALTQQVQTLTQAVQQIVQNTTPPVIAPTVPTVTAPVTTQPPVIVTPPIPTYTTPIVTVAKNPAVSDQTISAGSTDQLIGSFQIQNQSTDEAIDVSLLGVKISLNSATPYGGTITNLTVGGFTNMPQKNNVILPTSSSQPAPWEGFITDFQIPAGGSQIINVYADISSSAVGVVSVSLNPDAVGILSGIRVNPPAVIGQNITAN